MFEDDFLNLSCWQLICKVFNRALVGQLRNSHQMLFSLVSDISDALPGCVEELGLLGDQIVKIKPVVLYDGLHDNGHDVAGTEIAQLIKGRLVAIPIPIRFNQLVAKLLEPLVVLGHGHWLRLRLWSWGRRIAIRGNTKRDWRYLRFFGHDYSSKKARPAQNLKPVPQSSTG